MLHFFNRTRTASSNSLEIATRQRSLGISNSVEKIQRDFDLYMEKSRILTETLKEIDQNSALKLQTIEQQKLTNLMISLLDRILRLRTQINEKNNKNPEVEEAFNEFCDELVDLYFNDSDTSIVALWGLENKLKSTSETDPSRQQLALKIKYVQHYITGKQYRLKLLQEKINVQLESDNNQSNKSSLRKMYEQVMHVAEDSTNEPPFVALSLAHIICYFALSEIEDLKQKLSDLRQKLVSSRSALQYIQYDLMDEYNYVLAYLILISLRASMCNIFIKIKSSEDQIADARHINLETVFNQYQHFFMETYGSGQIDSDGIPLRIPSDLWRHINIALLENEEELECEHEITEHSAIVPIVPPSRKHNKITSL